MAMGRKVRSVPRVNTKGRSMSSDKNKSEAIFSKIGLTQLPRSRRSKHSEIISRILAELWDLERETALRVSRASLGAEKLSNVRAAVSRAVKKHGLEVTTSTDHEYFYLWFDGDGSRPPGAPPPAAPAKKSSGK